MVVCVGGAGVGAGALATGAVATGAVAPTSPACEPDFGVASCPVPPPEAREAAAALVAAADAASAASVRRSAAITAESRDSVRLLALFWPAATVDTLEVAALVVGAIVELTKALARPAPNRAIDVTIADGRMRRRVFDLRSARAPVARLAAMRSLATSSSSGSTALLGRITEGFIWESGLVVTAASVRVAVVVRG